MTDIEHDSFVLNGETHPFQAQSIATLLTELSISDLSAIVVEVNGVIIDKKYYAETMISRNDQVEVIRFVGGG